MLFIFVLAVAATAQEIPVTGDTKPEGCHFPFVYENVTYTSCILNDLGALWCSLDAVYVGNWKECGEEECVFPFYYDHHYQDLCVDTDHNGDGGWCSLDPVYEGNQVQCGRHCGGIVDHDHGQINTPDYPAPYDNNLDCFWTIQAHGGTVEITFQDFSLQAGNSVFGTCENDYLEIFSGYNSLGRWCGTSHPGPGVFHDDVTLHLVSDGSITSTGFNIKYKVEGSDHHNFGPGHPDYCGDQLHGHDGEISSPGYPTAYENNVDCTWTVSGKSHFLVLQFHDFALEKSTIYDGCSYDYVDIFKGNERVGRFCGDTLPPTVISYDEDVTIRFKTDADTVDRGFRFSWLYTDDPGSGDGSLP
ncbi:CUB domain-containing protein 2-like [Branchiostoma floridae x Branchiostoma belcheri]